MKRRLSSQNNKPLAGLSLDLDNQWSYLKTHGDPGWLEFPSYFDTLIPDLLDELDQRNLRITFFIVGQDAALPKNREALKLITDRGHGVGNHSYNHEPWIKSYTKEQIKRDILKAENLIFEVTGQKPIGFRGPGFAWNKHLLEILIENSYTYDASTLPTYLGPLARKYYFSKSGLSDDEKQKRKELFGRFKDGLRPLNPYCWELSSGKYILEIPVTTIPVVKIPFHLSYLLYISRYSELLMELYLKMAVALCKITKTRVSFLLHPLDFLGKEEVPELSFFPGMDLDKESKMSTFQKVIKILSDQFELVDLNTYAGHLLNDGNQRINKIE